MITTITVSGQTIFNNDNKTTVFIFLWPNQRIVLSNNNNLISISFPN